MPARNLMRIDDAVGPTQIQRKNQQRINFVSGEPEITLSEAVKAVQERLPQVMGQSRRTSASASAPKSSSRPRRSISCGWC